MNKMPGNVCLFVSFRDVDKGGCRQANRLESRSEHNVSSRASFYVPVFYWGRLKKNYNKKVKKRINVGRAGHLEMTQRLGLSPKGCRLLFD
jgi:hypothetical protein